jgi:hypothetical protein
MCSNFPVILAILFGKLAKTPAIAEATLYTGNQLDIFIQVYKDAHVRIKDNNLLGKSELFSIPPTPCGVS